MVGLNRLRAVSGLVLGSGAWALHHEFGAYLTFYDCRAASEPLMVVTGLGALAIAAIGGWLSWTAWRAAAPPPDRFIGALGMLAGALFALTLLVHLLASVLVPPCFR